MPYETCKESCRAMSTESESGWDLATIPTKYHNQLIVDKLSVDYPEVQTIVNHPLNFFWIGLL